MSETVLYLRLEQTYYPDTLFAKHEVPVGGMIVIIRILSTGEVSYGETLRRTDTGYSFDILNEGDLSTYTQKTGS